MNCNDLDYGTWKSVLAWMDDNREALKRYERFMSDPYYRACAEAWWRDQGWGDMPMQEHAVS